jgi:twitching motility protein PilT
MDPRNFLTAALKYLDRQGGSDLHLKVGHVPVIRVNRRLVKSEVDAPDVELMNGLLELFLTEQQCKRFEREKDFDVSYVNGDSQRFRVNTFLQQGKVGMVIRRIPDQIPSFKELVLPSIMEQVAGYERGLVLVTGSSGHGKSTTLASLVDHINQHRDCHIVTIEDPVEYTYQDQRSVINQREVGRDTESFYTALKGVVRQDPDVILVGELRDIETFEASLAAAETGHLVLSTMHARDISQLLDRIMAFFPQDQRDLVRMKLAFNLRAVLCQRLLRRSKGKGLIPAVEALVVNSTVRKLILEDKFAKLPQAIKSFTSEGMQTFNDSLAKLVKEGHVTLEEALAKSTNPDELKMMTKGIVLDSGKGILA